MVNPPSKPVMSGDSKRSSSRRTKPDTGHSDLFCDGWKMAVPMESRVKEIDQKLENVGYPAQRRRLESEKRRRYQSFAKLSRYPEVIPHISAYLTERNGKVEVVQDLMSYLRKRCPSLKMIGDPALRAFLRRGWGIGGSPGRKKKT
jgi:hypothetical protein